jgi:hypothetical protein
MYNDVDQTHTAFVRFAKPPAEQPHPMEVYEHYHNDREPLLETFQVPLHDIRRRLEDSSLGSIEKQIFDRSFAVAKHESQYYNQLDTVEGVGKYLEEIIS